LCCTEARIRDLLLGLYIDSNWMTKFKKYGRRIDKEKIKKLDIIFKKSTDRY